jgi:hypothetical protein
MDSQTHIDAFGKTILLQECIEMVFHEVSIPLFLSADLIQPLDELSDSTCQGNGG